MRKYRILISDRLGPVEKEALCHTDGAATRAARKAAQRRPVEVWDGARCVYTHPGRLRLRLAVAQQS